MDGSATAGVRGGTGRYGTDDVSDDVTQDAVLIFARILRSVLKSCPAVQMWIDTREPSAWEYTSKDGRESTVTRSTLHRWAVHDAAARNGYRIDERPNETDSKPGMQRMRGVPHAESVTSIAVATGVSQFSQAIFARAWGDGSDFPTLGNVIFLAGMADDLGRAGVLSTPAQSIYGGAFGSRRQVTRTRDAGLREYDELSERLNDARDDLVYRSMAVPSEQNPQAED
jgi:hypothetical protein